MAKNREKWTNWPNNRKNLGLLRLKKWISRNKGIGGNAFFLQGNTKF